MSCGLVATSVVVFLLVNVFAGGRVETTQALYREAVEYFLAHPELAADPRLIPAQVQRRFERGVAGAVERWPSRQRELDRRTQLWLEAAESDPLWAGSLIPSRPQPTSFVTYAFLHGGWAHLLSNLLFLYLTAPFVEDRWGRWRFLVFYFAAAVVSGAVFAARFPESYRPLVGASGAISAVMAAFLVHFATTRLSFLFMPFFPFPPYLPFRMPAWLVFPCWFATDLALAVAGDREGPGLGGGVAYWAHVGGFVFGLAVAAALRLVARGSARSRREAASTQAMVQARAAAQRGDLERAWQLAEGELRRGAGDEAPLLLWSVARRMGDPARGAPALEGVIRSALRGGREEEALARWRELAALCPHYRADPTLAAALLEILARRGETRELVARLATVIERLEHDVPTGTALRLLRLGVRYGVGGDRVAELAGRLLREPALAPADRRELEAMATG